MALFCAPMPPYTGDTKSDIEALRSWCCRLTSELRSVLYALDASNVIEARSVKASNIRGLISDSQLSGIDVSKITGDRSCINVSAGEENGVAFYSASSSGSPVLAARIYYRDEGDQPGLHIDAENIYAGGVKIN